MAFDLDPSSNGPRSKPIIPPNVLVDGICVGGSGAGKPYTRHALVKDLRKVADRSKVDFPMTGLFADRAPIGLYALFDGQRLVSKGAKETLEEFRSASKAFWELLGL